jgi:hypothetical protein
MNQEEDYSTLRIIKKNCELSKKNEQFLPNAHFFNFGT